MYPNLKLQIWKSGIRQNRLAQMLGMDETMLSKIVNGFREPSQDLRGRIASLLESQEDWLFERTSPREAPPSGPAVKAARRS
jgi:transcriptional regulator with XRE-family HTH domain